MQQNERNKMYNTWHMQIIHSHQQYIHIILFFPSVNPTGKWLFRIYNKHAFGSKGNYLEQWNRIYQQKITKEDFIQIREAWTFRKIYVLLIHWPPYTNFGTNKVLANFFLARSCSVNLNEYKCSQNKLCLYKLYEGKIIMAIQKKILKKIAK